MATNYRARFSNRSNKTESTRVTLTTPIPVRFKHNHHCRAKVVAIDSKNGNMVLGGGGVYSPAKLETLTT